MYGIEDRITATDIALIASNINPSSVTPGRRVYEIGHAVERDYLGAVTVEDSGEDFVLTLTDADGGVLAAESVTPDRAADRIAAIVHEVAYDGVRDEDLRETRLTGLRYIGSFTEHAKAQRDRLIREARTSGATYQELESASGLKRAMLDRIINDRNYG